MKRLDYPPIWLLAFIALAFVIDRFAATIGLGVRLGDWSVPVGGFLFAAGVVLTALAAWEFSRAKTSIIPHQKPTAIITTGIFAYSRNPIYLADVLILTGVILYLEAILAVPLVPIFALILRKRFIEAEEKRLEDAFPTEFQAYYTATRRWI